MVQALRNIPRKKLEIALEELDQKYEDFQKRSVLKKVYHRYFDANIPVMYWPLEMEKHFEGDPTLLEKYREITSDLSKTYKEGISICMAGQHGTGKQLDLETEIPTINGFVKLADLKEGDQIFDENGNICNVVKLHPINISPESYKITFDDGTTINACADHLWLTYTREDRSSVNKEKSVNRRREKRRLLNQKRREDQEINKNRILEPTVKNTKQLLETVRVNGKQQIANHSIKCCKPLMYPERNLPIDPYVLGAWLGDGTTCNAEIESADEEIVNSIINAGYEVNQRAKTTISKSKRYSIGPLLKIDGRTINKLTLELKNNNLINNKHIPKEYLIASYEQRLALLQGLLDTDGTCDKSGKIEYCSALKELAEGVLELVLSLGIKARIICNKSFLYEKRCKDRYRVNFTTKLPVFRLSRKLEKLRFEKTQESRTTHRFILNIEKIDPRPMRCITVDSPSHLYLVTRNFIATHNTTAVTSILKRAVEKGFSALYVNLNDIMSVIKSPDAHYARQELFKIDFLVIDEFDPRYMSTDSSSDFYGRVLEDILRNRAQNKLPLFLCTNSPNVIQSFNAEIKQSISSLMNYVKIQPVLGTDYRKKIKESNG